MLSIPKRPPDPHDARMKYHFLRTVGGWAAWCKESGTWEDPGSLRLAWPRTVTSSPWAFEAFYAGIREVVSLLDEDDNYHADMVLQHALVLWDGLVVATHWTFFLRLIDLYDMLLARGFPQLRKKIAKAIVAKAWLALPLRDPRLLIYRDLYQMQDDSLLGVYELAATEQALIDSLGPLLGPEHPEILYLRQWQKPEMADHRVKRRLGRMEDILKVYELAVRQADFECLYELGFANELSVLNACERYLLTPEHYHKALSISRWILGQMPNFAYHPQEIECYTSRTQAWTIIVYHPRGYRVL